MYYDSLYYYQNFLSYFTFKNMIVGNLAITNVILAAMLLTYWFSSDNPWEGYWNE